MFEITNKTKGKVPTLPFEDMKNTALGDAYELSLVFIGSTRSRRLNRERRGKDKPANILSFPLSLSEGEIFIDLAQARKEAPLYERNFDNFVAFLFIHGLLHLKGMAHGSKMEEAEEKVRNQFSV